MSISLHRRPSVRKRRKSALIASGIAIFIVLVIYLSHSTYYVDDLGLKSPTEGEIATKEASSHPLLKQHARFWRAFYHIILNNDPQCKNPPDVVIPEKLDIAYQSDDHGHARPDVLWLDNADVQRLKAAHQNFLNDVQAARPKVNLVYEKGTRGVITTVSDTQIPLLLIQLRMLRMTGSSLPVEVFLSKSTPYTNRVCKKLLPNLSASCIYYTDIFDAAGTGVSVSSYQYKILAILFSSFDEVLLLDSDAWPIDNPDHLFTYPPFMDSGLILWPDFWYASESPYFFHIAKIENPPKLHVKPSIESGEVMYRKSMHETSILLAAYYNYFGPEYYYPLLSQGAPGQGDKETFASAAMALKEDFYWVKTMVAAVGRIDSSGPFLGSAMIQHDPIVDLHSHPRQASLYDAVEVNNTPSMDDRQKQKQQKQQPPDDTNHGHAEFSLRNHTMSTFTSSKTHRKAMFVHANTPKFDPRTIFSDHDMGSGIRTSPTRDTNGTQVRCWGLSAEQIDDLFRGIDVEKRFWEAIKMVACEDLIVAADDSDGMGGGRDKMREMEACKRVEEYFGNVFGG